MPEARKGACTRTNYYSPYCLVVWGGWMPGKRPCTRRGWIETADVEPVTGRLKSAMLYTCSADGKWTKRPTRYDRASIVKTWRKVPTKAQVEAARRELPARHY